MNFVRSRQGDDIGIQIVDELTFDDYIEWRHMFEDVLAETPGQITLDLTKLQIFDSAALGMILIFKERAEGANAVFKIVQPDTGHMRHALELAQLSVERC